LFLPLGPSKWTTPESTVAFTLSPSVMGSFPMRLMMVLSVDGASVDVAEDLAANLLATGLGVRHDTAGGGEDGHAKTAQDAGDLEVSDVAAQARARDALETDDDRGTIRTVLQLHGHIVLGLLLVDHVVDDEALFLEDLEDLDLQAAGREREALVLRARGVADAGEEITHRVIHWHGRDCLLSAWCVRLPHRLPAPDRPDFRAVLRSGKRGTERDTGPLSAPRAFRAHPGGSLSGAGLLRTACCVLRPSACSRRECPRSELTFRSPRPLPPPVGPSPETGKRRRRAPGIPGCASRPLPPPDYQDDLVTPVTSPLSARLRRQMRH